MFLMLPSPRFRLKIRLLSKPLFIFLFLTPSVTIPTCYLTQCVFSSCPSQGLDLTTKRMIHEGPLTWKVNKDKQIGQNLPVDTYSHQFVCVPLTHIVRVPPSEIQALLLSDSLVLLQRGPDDRLLLRYPSRWLGGGVGGSGDSKTFFSPLVKLDSLLVRSVATGQERLTSDLIFPSGFLDDIMYVMVL